MNHEEWQTLVSAYHDGQVTAAEQAQVEAHLAECAECQALLADYRRLGQAIHSLPRGEPSRALWTRVQAKLPARRQSLWRRLLPVTSVVAMLVVGITVVAVLRLGQMGTAQPLLQKEVAEPRAAVAPTSIAIATPAAPLPARTPSDVLGITSSGALPEDTPLPCPRAPLAMEVVSLSVTRDAALESPQVRGTLYDAAGRPVAGATLVISGTAGWQGLATTSGDGTFVLALPSAGPYRVLLGWSADEGQSDREDVKWNVYTPPDDSTCPLLPRLEMVPVTLEANEVAIITLRLR